MGGEAGGGGREEGDFPLELSSLSLSFLKLFFLLSVREHNDRLVGIKERAPWHNVPA